MTGRNQWFHKRDHLIGTQDCPVCLHVFMVYLKRRDDMVSVILNDRAVGKLTAAACELFLKQCPVNVIVWTDRVLVVNTRKRSVLSSQTNGGK